MANEFNYPTEVGVTGREFNFPAEEAIRFSEFDHPADVETPKSKASITAKMKKMVYLLAACGSVASLSFAAFFIDSPEEDNTSTEVSSAVSVDEPAPLVSGFFDTAFPVLSNLEPNGLLNNEGNTLDEQYILIKQNGTSASLCAGNVRPELQSILTDGDASVYYEESSNTVYLKDATLQHLEANLMGNSFTVNVSGECNVDELIGWGFFYGGSITITGTGTLNIGYGNTPQYGILIHGENSESCLMIDRGVTLNVKGSVAAISIEETTMSQAIYCLSPADSSYSRGISDSDMIYTILDENGKVLKEVSFSPEK